MGAWSLCLLGQRGQALLLRCYKSHSESRPGEARAGMGWMEAKATAQEACVWHQQELAGEGRQGYLWVRTQVLGGAQGWILGPGPRLSSGTND